MRFWDTNRSPNFGQTTRPCEIDKKMKKKRTCEIVFFSVPVDQWVELKEGKNKDKYQGFARKLKKKTMAHESDGDASCN